MSSAHRFKRMVSSPAADSSDTVLQKITAQKSRAAIFLVLTINPDPADAASVLTFGPIFRLSSGRSDLAIRKRVFPASWVLARKHGIGYLTVPRGPWNSIPFASIMPSPAMP
jgi:hypothetical protein